MIKIMLKLHMTEEEQQRHLIRNVEGRRAEQVSLNTVEKHWIGKL